MYEYKNRDPGAIVQKITTPGPRQTEIEAGLKAITLEPTPGTSEEAGTSDESDEIVKTIKDSEPSPKGTKGYFDFVVGQYVVTGSYDGDIRFYCPAQAHYLGKLPALNSYLKQINKLSLTRDNHYLAAASDDIVRLFDLNCQGVVLGDLKHPNKALVVGYEPDGRWLYVGGEDGVCRIWDKRNDQFVATIQLDVDHISSMVLNRDRTQIYLSMETAYTGIWDLRTGKYVPLWMPRHARPHNEWIKSLAIRPDGKQVTGLTSKSQLLAWEMDTNCANPERQPVVFRDRRRKAKIPLTYALDSTYSPDGKLLAATSCGVNIHLFNSETLLLKSVILADLRWNWTVAFSPTASHLLSGSQDGRMRVWEIDTGKKVHQWHSHQSAITAMAIN
ncbi:unnamed protein product [Caenorhabditis sp. 36 PRJEB53466]|nr:unnamed protein product [Caenorhabditis sp. 36 PRJEB53466]